MYMCMYMYIYVYLELSSYPFGKNVFCFFMHHFTELYMRNNANGLTKINLILNMLSENQV